MLLLTFTLRCASNNCYCLYFCNCCSYCSLWQCCNFIIANAAACPGEILLILSLLLTGLTATAAAPPPPPILSTSGFTTRSALLSLDLLFFPSCALSAAAALVSNSIISFSRTRHCVASIKFYYSYSSAWRTMGNRSVCLMLGRRAGSFCRHHSTILRNYAE